MRELFGIDQFGTRGAKLRTSVRVRPMNTSEKQVRTYGRVRGFLLESMEWNETTKIDVPIEERRIIIPLLATECNEFYVYKVFLAGCFLSMYGWG